MAWYSRPHGRPRVSNRPVTEVHEGPCTRASLVEDLFIQIEWEMLLFSPASAYNLKPFVLKKFEIIPTRSQTAQHTGPRRTGYLVSSRPGRSRQKL